MSILLVECTPHVLKRLIGFGKLIPTVCRTVKRSLPILCLVLAATSNNVMAQNTINFCEPSPAVKDELKKLPGGHLFLRKHDGRK